MISMVSKADLTHQVESSSVPVSVVDPLTNQALECATINMPPSSCLAVKDNY
jgi:hypothetical protein